MKKLGIVIIICVQFFVWCTATDAADKQQLVNTITQAAHAYWAQRVVIDHPVDGTLYGYSGGQTVIDPSDPNDRYYSSDWGWLPEPHIFQEVEDTPGHPSVGFAFIRAYEATGDKFAMRAAKHLGDTLISAQNDLGVGGWWQDMGIIGYDRRAGSPTYGTVIDFGEWMNLSPWGGHGNVLLGNQDIASFDGCSYLSGYYLLRLYQALPVNDPDRDRYLQSAKWLADEIVGFKDVVDAQGGFNPYGNGGVPQIWPYNVMKNRLPGYEAYAAYPYTIPHNVMVTLNDDAMEGALMFLIEFWKESQTNPALNEIEYLDAIRLNMDYLMDVFDITANANGRSAWASFYWINDGSARANKPTWGRAYEPPGLGFASERGDEPLLAWWQYETNATRKLRIEDTLKRQMLYFKYDAPPVNSDAPGSNPDLWRDIIRPYIRNGQHLDGYDPSRIITWWWWRLYNHDESAEEREVFVAAESPPVPSHYDIHYDEEALVEENNPDDHYPMMPFNKIAYKMFYALTPQDNLYLFDPGNPVHNNKLNEYYDLIPEIRMFRGRPNADLYLNYALGWFDANDGFFKPTGSLPSITRNNRTYYYVSDSIFQTSMRYLAWGFENGTGTLTDSDGDGFTDQEETQAGTDIHDSESYPGGQPPEPPIANAGPDQTVTDEDNDGEEQVTLDGSASQDPDGEIVSYVWSEGGSQIATGVNPTVTLSTGTHSITLTVTDNGGLTDTDTVTITVSPFNQPIANAGPDQTVIDENSDGSEPVTLDGSASQDPDGEIVSYVWSEDDSQIATGVNPTVILSTGTHLITLTVTDNEGLTDTDTVSIIVNQPPIANAGPDQTVTDEDNDGEEQVTLDGSASRDPDGEIVSFIWSEDDSQIATGINPTVTLSTGTHSITLTVADDGGLTDTDTVTIKVLEGDKGFGELPGGCYNNVFNPAKGEKAIIVVELPKQARVKLGLYNTRGKRIRELADEQKEAGTHKYYWDGKSGNGNVVGSGLYFVHIQAGDYKKTKKIVVIK